MAKELTCPHCRHEGDVIERLRYEGGQGLAQVPECRDRNECWARWDEQHGFSLRGKG